MARKDKFGKFVLLDQLDATAIGQEYRAAKLGTGGLEKVVTVLKLKPALSGSADAVKSLMDQVKFAAQLQNPNILKIYGIGKVEQAYYISYEFLEGKSLKGIFARCRQEGFPFSVDHALLIASKVCSALEYAHARRTEGGGRYFHGQVTPGGVLVSYEGEVRVRDFGVWPSRVREAGGGVPEDAAYLSPEQASGVGGDNRSDIYAVGTLLFETLTGEPFATPDRREEAGPRLAKARLQNPTGDDDALPRPIVDILNKSLATDPGARYGEIQEMRKAVDTLLFSGDFTPTTFNLAFFMHSLFREDIERETKALKEEKEASYFEYLTEEPARVPAATAAVKPVTSPSTTQPVDLRALGIKPEPTPVREQAPPPPTPARPSTPPPVAHHPAPSEPPHPAPAAAEPAPAAPHAFTFHKEGPRSRLPLVAGGLLVLALAAGGAWWFMRSRAARQAAASPPPTTLSAEAQAAALRIQELEQKLQLMETERAAAEAKAAEDAKKKVEQQAKARGQEVDPAALAKAQEEARKKAQAEQERKQEEERRRLEEERKAEEARLAEERRRAEEEAARLAAAAATTLPAPPPTTAAPPPPAVTPGQLVDLNDAGVIAPVVQRQANPVYPPIALRQRLDGVVELSVLVDEKGNVADAKLVSGAGGKAGLNEAAIDSVRKRKYRPALKDGVPVKVWVPVRVQFRLPS